MTNTNVTAGRLAELGGATNAGIKIGFVDSGAFAATNDTWTVMNATEIIWCSCTVDADGEANPATISGNVITLTGTTATATSGFIIFK
jgi:hypothetical protein